MYIIVYRPHNELNLNTKYIGPFMSFDRAYDALCALPALGWHKVDADNCVDNPGVKDIVELVPPTPFKIGG